MSSSRIGRVTKGRVLFCIISVIFLLALLAYYKNTTTLLEESQKAYEICRQEQENISQQLHVVFDYKQRLEKNLQSEKAEHQNIKTDYMNRLNEEKLKCEKSNSEAKLRFSTLQQHYNLLQTQHDDFKEDCSKIQREQLDSINQLQSKLKETQEQLKRTIIDKDNSIQHIKAQYEAMQQDNLQLKLKLKNVQSEPELVHRKEYSSTQFNKVIVDGDGHYALNGNANANFNQENEAVLVPPKLKQKPVSPKSLVTPKTSPNSVLSGGSPLNPPSVDPKVIKSSSTTKKLEPLLPLPYQANMPSNVVPAPDMHPENDAHNNFDGKAGDPRKDDLKNEFIADNADNENGAQEEFDLPNVEGKNPAQKKHIDEPPNGIDADYDPHNNLDDGDDDAADGANLIPQDEAIRN